ncbi:leucine-rich repeat-containing protein 69 [Solea senegalensis]|uniref:Leucine-rich repeat-containing protein 69 n=1 Tax=Solea senegalensis TaxID=28829 RepID=A0AAV6R9M4_SOLSE|nr:leucine-rich repeat-containing protein 69 isoform X1 [Solea senegalensis]XP_043907930.1 leucine-rich repeat-containing protein 69 isoform X1 [Solea senegalensis]KAG7500627.1 leucine-rich repeat-containing protein 69 [Solea senegalensis]
MAESVVGAIDVSVVRALYGNSPSLNLSSKKIREVPKCVSRLTKLSVLLLNNNCITSLPAELLSLQHLTQLNLGNNSLKEVPAALGHLESLKKLYLFSNQITVVPPEVIDGLHNLVVLNLNHNKIQSLPLEIKSLMKLEHLSVLDNKLEELPAELGHLSKLSEINLTSNRLCCLPQQLCQCKDLTKLHVARNKLTSLPEGITALEKLQVVDVAGNKLSVFPVEFHRLPLKELYCEGNRFVQCEPVQSEQDAEVLTLKELVARFVLWEDRNRVSLVHRMLPHYPCLSALLANGSCCALCQGPFLTTWLECVHFVNLRKDMKVRSSLTIPVRAVLCSYKCFNTEGHCYYGVATR